MSERQTPRQPVTTWDYCVSAVDQLVLWYADTAPETGREPLRTQTVDLLAAVLHD